MAACEICWTEANRKVMFLGGSVSDRYELELAANPDGHEAVSPDA